MPPVYSFTRATATTNLWVLPKDLAWSETTEGRAQEEAEAARSVSVFWSLDHRAENLHGQLRQTYGPATFFGSLLSQRGEGGIGVNPPLASLSVDGAPPCRLPTALPRPRKRFGVAVTSENEDQRRKPIPINAAAREARREWSPTREYPKIRCSSVFLSWSCKEWLFVCACVCMCACVCLFKQQRG